MNPILLQSPGASSATTLIMMVGMILVFYFFMIRPQTKKAKEQKNFINNLQKGDKVVTIAGIHGKVNKMKMAQWNWKPAREAILKLKNRL